MLLSRAEVSRVATADNEQEWLDAVRGKSLRVVEELVSGKAPGDKPGDPDRPDVRMHRLTLELSPEVYARLREVRTRLADEDGHRPDDDALVALCPEDKARCPENMALCPEDKARCPEDIALCPEDKPRCPEAKATRPEVV